MMSNRHWRGVVALTLLAAAIFCTALLVGSAGLSAASALRALFGGGDEFSRMIVPGLDRLYESYSFRIVPLLGAIVAQDRAAYQYLVESIRRFPPQDELAGLMRAAGFEQVRYRNLSGGIAAIHSGWRM